MRYNDDVINADKWNTGLKKSDLPEIPDSNKTARHQKSAIPEKRTDMHISNPDILRVTKINPSYSNIRSSKSRISRKKRGGIFHLAGLLTGLVHRSRNNK